MIENLVTYMNIKKFVEDSRLSKEDSARILRAAMQVSDFGGTIAKNQLTFVLNSRRKDFLFSFENNPEHQKIFEENIAWYREQTEDHSPKIDNILLKRNILSFLRKRRNGGANFDTIAENFPVDTPTRTLMLLDHLQADGEITISKDTESRYQAVQKNSPI